MEVDAVKKGNRAFMRKSVISKNGFIQVYYILFHLIASVPICNLTNSVLAEPTFVFLSNPTQVYHSMQISFFGKNKILRLINIGQDSWNL